MWYAVWYTVRYATAALLVRDLISTAHYVELTRPLAAVIGPLHPDDEPV